MSKIVIMQDKSEKTCKSRHPNHVTSKATITHNHRAKVVNRKQIAVRSDLALVAINGGRYARMPLKSIMNYADAFPVILRKSVGDTYIEYDM